MPYLYIVKDPESLVRHSDQHKTDYERIPVRKLVREMKAVPYEIQLVYVQTDEHECQKCHIQHFFPRAESLARQVKYQHYHCKDPAIQVRQTLTECQLAVRQQLIENIERIAVKSRIFRHVH